MTESEIPLLLQRASESLLSARRENVYAALVVLVGVYFAGAFLFPRRPNFPSINYDKSEWTNKEAISKFRSSSKKLLADGFKKFSGPFNIVTDVGPLIMLSPDYIEAVNHEPKLDFFQYINEDLLGKYETFVNFRPQLPGFAEEVVMKGLTRSLRLSSANGHTCEAKFTKALSDESTSVLHDTWGESKEWHDVDLRANVLTWIARLSSRIFNGELLTNNEEWLTISKEFTVNLFTATRQVKQYPTLLRWPAERLLPLCRKTRAQIAAATRLLAPIFQERNAEITAAKREGREPNLPNDAIEPSQWSRSAARGRPYNPVNTLMGLSLAAIHTTSDLLGQALLNVCAHPEMVEPLRAEAIEVLKKHGWKKQAVAELYLMDSFFKETQRVKPISMSHMHRLAMEDVELPGGVKIRKGERMGISSHKMWSGPEWENPETFDGYRFLNRRKTPGFEHKSLLISTSADHTAFSHGKHACPGRFFAANEVKIAMVHLILKYDMKLKDAKDAKWFEYGLSMSANPFAKISVRRRKEEIDLDTSAVE
ncbi:Cytochrome P450 monooxygenase easM [Lachnellula suecica]|uniref:Cytochrome P450 monooxygenase easM n=1 Tax=Lachnellula suecica TaxID=602035 RepID=A0A8T9C0I9_9HELO|nr:Cytochrome P450 monooxygenase easM [Lachnellula suecica]